MSFFSSLWACPKQAEAAQHIVRRRNRRVFAMRSTSGIDFPGPSITSCQKSQTFFEELSGNGFTRMRRQTGLLRRSFLVYSHSLYQFSKVLTDSRGRNSRPDNHRLVGQASRLSTNDGQDARPTKSSAISVITFENRYRTFSDCLFASFRPQPKSSHRSDESRKPVFSGPASAGATGMCHPERTLDRRSSRLKLNAFHPVELHSASGPILGLGFLIFVSWGCLVLAWLRPFERAFHRSIHNRNPQ